MILVDTSVWIDHLREGDAHLIRLLQGGLVLGHPWVTGEISLGNIAHREEILRLLRNLPQAKSATDDEVSTLIERHELAGAGIGYTDAHLVASTKLTPGAELWTRDRRLRAIATRLEIVHSHS